jgi:hypothetical protein
MPRGVPRLAPLSAPSALVSPFKVHKQGSKVVFSQKTRLWFRAAVCFWATVVFLTPFMIYFNFFSSQTTRFTCDRSTGACEVDGQTRDVPRLGDINRAVLDHDFNRRDGANYGIELITREGKKYPIEQQRAIKDSVIADYRKTVKAINAYVADPTQQKLDTSFTYRAGAWERFQSIFYFLFGVGTLFVAWRLWTTRLLTVEPGKITIVERHPFNRQTGEIAADRVSGIAFREFSDRRVVELKLDDASTVQVVNAGRMEALMADQMARELAGSLGKPLERP